MTSPQGMAGILPLLDLSLLALEQLSRVRPDPLVTAMLARRRRAVVALHRQARLALPRVAPAQAAPDLAAMIAAEWRLAHGIGGLLREGRQADEDTIFLRRLVAEIEETALSLRLLDKRRHTSP